MHWSSDYCNAVLSEVHGIHLRRLNGLLRASARMIFHCRNTIYCAILSIGWASVKEWSKTVYDRLQVPSQRSPIVRSLWRCSNQFTTSLVVAPYVPPPVLIWLSREPKRQPTDDAVLQCRGQQAGTHYLNHSVMQPRHSENSENVAVPFGQRA